MPLELAITPNAAKTAAAALRNRAAILSATLARSHPGRIGSAKELSTLQHELDAIERVAAELDLAYARAVGAGPPALR